MDNECIKIKIQDHDEISGTEKLNKNQNNVKGGEMIWKMKTKCCK